jgi:hypothetical protein
MSWHPRIRLGNGEIFLVVPRGAVMLFHDERAAEQLVRDALRDPSIAEDLRQLARSRSLAFDPLDDDTVVRQLAQQLIHGELIAVVDGDRLLPWTGTMSLEPRAVPAPTRPRTSEVPQVPHAPSSPREEKAVLSLRLVTDDGLPLDGARLLVHEGSTSHDLRTDAKGLATLELAEGPYDVNLVEPPIALPPTPAVVGEPRRDVLIERSRIDPFVVSARPPGAEPRVVAVRRPRCTEVAIDGYAQGSKVLRWGGMRPREDGTVGTARAALRTALWLGRGKTMCVAGHADPLGQDADNHSLSAARATSVHLFASGDLEAWAGHAAANADDTDLACALVACHRILGMGPASFDDRDALDAALKGVRMNAGLAEDGPASARDWHAFADLYEADLAALLFTDRAGLAEIRGAIDWTEPPTVALGETWPRPESELTDQVGSSALAHRRSSLLIFEQRDDPQRATETNGVEIYDGTYRRTTVSVPGEVMVDIAIDTPARDPIARGRAWVEIGAFGVHHHIAGDDGHIRFMTCCGDRIAVVAACDANGSGTLIAAGTGGTSHAESR